MRYNWNYKELRDNKNELINLLDTTSDIKDKEEIEATIEMYNEMLKLANKNINAYSQFDDTMESLDINDLILDFSYSYSKDMLPILNLLLPAMKVLKDKKNNVARTFKIGDNNDEIVTVTLDFFSKMTTPDIYKKVEERFENKHFLNITYYKEMNPFPGVTFIDGVLKKKYIAMSRNNEVLDLVHLAHELFHDTFSDYEVKTIFEHKTFYLTEVEGMLANILFGEYFKKYIGNNDEEIDNDLIKNYFLEGFNNEITDLVIRNSIIEAIDNKGKLRLTKLNKYITSYNISDINDLNDLIHYLNTPQATHITYALSYLVAIDLLYIYIRDREEAFYLLKNFRYIKNEDDIISLLKRNNITFFEDDYKNLKDYIGLNKRKIKKIGGDKND